jgi:hypothetical protein
VKKVLVAVRSRRDVATIASMKMLGKIFLVALIGIVITADYAQGQALKKQLVGTWSLVSLVNDVDGKKIELFGPNPNGQFVFTSDGHFSMNIVRPDRQKFASNNRLTGTPEENKEAVLGNISIFGSYTINSDGSLKMHIAGSNFSNWDGTEQIRRAQITGDEMKYTNPTPSTGSGTAVMILRRAK